MTGLLCFQLPSSRFGYTVASNIFVVNLGMVLLFVENPGFKLGSKILYMICTSREGKEC